jgi:hypothetical protein
MTQIDNTQITDIRKKAKEWPRSIEVWCSAVLAAPAACLVYLRDMGFPIEIVFLSRTA